jgi:hypothetical protein
MSNTMAPAENVDDLLDKGVDDSSPSDPVGSLSERMAFKAFAGLLMGAPTGAACCWLTEMFDQFWLHVAIGAAAGAFIGLILGFRAPKVQKPPARLNLASNLCASYGVLLSLLLFVQCAGGIQGKQSGMVFIGFLFAGPLAGLLLGGILDRAFEEFKMRKQFLAIGTTFIAIAASASTIVLFDWLCYGPDTEFIASRIETMVVSEFELRREIKKARIQHLDVHRNGRFGYVGSFDATFDGQPKRMTFEAMIEDGRLSLEMKTVNEP